MKTIDLSHYFNNSIQEDSETLKGYQARLILDWVLNGAVNQRDARQLYDMLELG